MKVVYDDKESGTLSSLGTSRIHTLGYGAWLRDNCLVTRDGFRGSHIGNWNIEMTNEEAYEMYLESLKDK